MYIIPYFFNIFYYILLIMYIFYHKFQKISDSNTIVQVAILTVLKFFLFLRMRYLFFINLRYFFNRTLRNNLAVVKKDCRVANCHNLVNTVRYKKNSYSAFKKRLNFCKALLSKTCVTD